MKIYIFLLLVLIGGFVYLDSVSTKPVDWSPSYRMDDKIPFGLFVLDKEFENIIPKDSVTQLDNTLYEHFNKNYYGLTQKSGINLLHICDEYHIDDESTKEVFDFVAKGNTAFLSVNYLPKIYTDSLKVELSPRKDFTSKTQCWMSNPNLGIQKYDLEKGVGYQYFSSIDTLNTIVLGYQNDGKEKRVNFIQVPFKKGTFYIHLQPNAFTNYHLLKDNHAEYAEKVLSYLPKKQTIWLAKDQIGFLQSGSPMRYILSQPALKWAWYIFLIGILTFMIFNAKRRQRIIPIIKPLPNTTVDFTKTIGNLYYQEGNHQNIIDKKIIYFLERIRNDYLMDTSVLNEDFIKKLQAKSGKDIKDIERVIYLINYQRTSPHQSVENDLIELNKAIEKIIN